MKRSSFARLAGASLLCCFMLSSFSARADALKDANKLFKGGQYDAAMKQVDAWLAKNPKDAQGRFLKGLILTEENKSGEAIKVFTGLTEDYPELPEPYNNLAVLYAAQGQYEKAKDELESAIQTHPSYATAHENLGDIYAKLASQAYDKALQLDKSNVSAQTKLELIKTLFSREGQPAVTKHAVTSAGDKKIAKKTEEVAVPVPPVSAESSAKAEPVKKEPSGDEQAVIATLQAWAKAWSDQDVAGYLGFYAGDFQPSDGRGLDHWKQLRKARIEKPKFISVTISNPEVVFSDEKHATIRFTQSYKSSAMEESTAKIMTLSNSSGRWLIETEK
ncbi:MAG: L,D-transpeptidase Cds6 family protein [Burkholderiales bacterium]